MFNFILFFVLQQTASQGEGDVAGLMEEDALSGPEAGESNGVETDDDKQEIVQSRQGYSSTTIRNRNGTQSEGTLEDITEECHTHQHNHRDKCNVHVSSVTIPGRLSSTHDDEELHSGRFVFRSSHDAGSLNANVKEHDSVSFHKEPSHVMQEFDDSNKTSAIQTQSNNCVFDSRCRVGLNIVKTNGAVMDKHRQGLLGGSLLAEEGKRKATITNGYHSNCKDSGSNDEPVRRASFSDLRSRFESATEKSSEPQVKRKISATKVHNGLARSAVSTSYLTLQTSSKESDDKPQIESVTDSVCHGDNGYVTKIDVDELVQNIVDSNDIVDYEHYKSDIDNVDTDDNVEEENGKNAVDGLVKVSNHENVASVRLSTSSCDETVREGEPRKDVESIDTSTCLQHDPQDDNGSSCVDIQQETQVSRANVVLSVSRDEDQSDIMDHMEHQSHASLSGEENGEVVKIELPKELNMSRAGEDIDQEEGNTKGDALSNSNMVYMGKESK